MTPERIGELRRVCDRATPGPWSFPSWDEDPFPGEGDLDGYAHIKECDVMEPTGIQHANDYEGYWHDWRFIQCARTALPEALDEIEKLKDELSELRGWEDNDTSFLVGPGPDNYGEGWLSADADSHTKSGEV